MRAPRRADAHPHRVDHLLNRFPRLTRNIDRQLGADQLHHIRARERRLINARGHLRQVCAVQGAPRCALPRFALSEMRAAVEHQAAPIGAPLRP